MSKSTAPRTYAPSRLPLPAAVDRRRWHWPYVIGVAGLHLLATLALVPSLFSWSGAALAFLGLYVFGTLGVNLGFHRLLTHRGFRCGRRLEHAFATLGVCCFQDTPAHWVSVHRMHHQHSDERPDPHTPLVNFVWAHFGWLLVENRDLDRRVLFERYGKDVVRDPFYLRFERGMNWIWLNLFSWSLFFLAGMAVGGWSSGELSEGLRLGASWTVWGAFVRTVAVWHITWSVNSVTHLWGYRNYETGENSRNNVFVGILSNGEGWHNNHHAQPRSAAHGHRWWEFDVTYATIRLLRLVGLVWDVVQPSERLAQQQAAADREAGGGSW